MASYRRYPSNGTCIDKGKSLLKNLSTRRMFIDHQQYHNGWYGLYNWGHDKIELIKKSKLNTCGEDIVCSYNNRIYFHTHSSYYNKDHKYLPPSCVDLMRTFDESIQKKKPTYHLLVDGSGFYFYRPSDNLFESVNKMIQNRSGWGFDLWRTCTNYNKSTKYTELIWKKINEWKSCIDFDIEEQLKEGNFETVNECLQHYYNQIDFDIFFISKYENNVYFNMIDEKIC